PGRQRLHGPGGRGEPEAVRLRGPGADPRRRRRRVHRLAGPCAAARLRRPRHRRRRRAGAPGGAGDARRMPRKPVPRANPGFAPTHLPLVRRPRTIAPVQGGRLTAGERKDSMTRLRLASAIPVLGALLLAATPAAPQTPQGGPPPPA